MNFHLSSHSQAGSCGFDRTFCDYHGSFNFEYALLFDFLVIYSWKNFAQFCCTLAVAHMETFISFTNQSQGRDRIFRSVPLIKACHPSKSKLKLFPIKDELDYVWTFYLFVCFRATQYACALAKYLLRNEAKRKELVKKLQTLESNMSSGRKRKNEHFLLHNNT